MQIQTIAAETVFAPIPWTKVALEDGFIICKESGFSRVEELTELTPPLENPHFWKEVRQLYFAFEQKDWQKIRLFYQTNGPLGLENPRAPDGTILDNHPPNRERISTCKRFLNWFRILTLMVKWAKTRNTAPLWDLFGPPRKSKDILTLSILFAEEWPWPAIWYTPSLDINWDTPINRDELAWISPQNDEQLIRAAWMAVVGAVTEMLRFTPLLPMTVSEDPFVITWGFQCNGAFFAAFLQWFFQEIAYINVSTCQADGCNNLVIPPRDKYCSDRCKERMKKRRYRQRKKGDLKWLDG
ncbi:hypothetical protein MTAT_04880 [Moorella thermoacetica]|uniref:CGNR zinc finger n=1 Tax=Neomoorella thermoacetica TaxID=1525 RepID=A0AAC9HHP0_NEOTH|nr:hypothetical protein [Moorella thermoacetica]AOQ23855.1 hypothetical protein Maut_01410 [Moorella thermoacetica]TYL14259.1 hypothetical protein MTAT_04880 [Moorella thermoacetica]